MLSTSEMMPEARSRNAYRLPYLRTEYDTQKNPDCTLNDESTRGLFSKENGQRKMFY